MLMSALLSLAALAVTPAASISRLAISPCDAGEHYQFEVVECPFELRNTGETPIHVSKAQSRFPWDTIDTSTITVPPKGSAYIKATADLRNSEGRTVRVFRFDTDEPGNTRRGSEIRSFVLSVLDQSKPTLDFGTVKLEDPLPERSIELSSREVKDFRILAIESKPDWIDATVGKDGRSITARLKPSVPWGLIHHDHFIKLKINAAQQPFVWVAIEAQVLGDVAPDGNPFQLGLLRTGGKHEFLIRITSRSGKDIRLGKLEVAHVEASATPEECSPAAKSCRLIRVRLADNIQPSKIEAILNIELPDFHKTLPIELIGMLVSADTKIHSLDELTPSEGAQSQSSASKSLNLASAINSSVKKAEPPPPGTGPLLKWSAAHQETIYGYVIYRAEQASGPFLRVNKAVIRVVGEGEDNSGTYQWRDDTAESGRTYWYSIGVINRNGSRQDLTGAQKVVAK